MWSKVLTPEEAARVWSILVVFAGARLSQTDMFMHHAVVNGVTEYRFIGKLGFGGKYYSDNRVSCYPEDRTPERDEIIRITNEKLKALNLS